MENTMPNTVPAAATGLPKPSRRKVMTAANRRTIVETINAPVAYTAEDTAEAARTIAYYESAGCKFGWNPNPFTYEWTDMGGRHSTCTITDADAKPAVEAMRAILKACEDKAATEDADPIFAAIAAARKAYAAMDDTDESTDVAAAAENAVYQIKPATFAGALAMLQYLAERAKADNSFCERHHYDALANIAAAMIETAGRPEGRL
jgi:hypothetical protein